MTQWFGRMKPWFLTETCLNIKSESCPCLCGPSRSIPAFTLIEPPGSYFERRRPEKLSGRRVSAMDVQGCVRQPQPHSESPTSRHSLPGCPAIPTAQTDGQPPGPAGRHVRRPSRPPDRASSGVSSHGLRVYWELKDGWGQLCWATRVGTPSPAARPCRRHRSTGSRRLQAGRRVGKLTV